MKNFRRDRIATRAANRDATLKTKEVGYSKGVDTQSRWRDDVGYKMTDSQYNQYMSETGGALTGSALGRTQSELEKAKGRLDEASRLTLQGLWEDQMESWVPVRVVDPSGNNVEAVYRLPREAISTLAENVPTEQNWVDDDKFYNISTRVKESGDIIGQEVHDALTTTLGSLEADFYRTNAKGYTEGMSAVSGAQGEVTGALGTTGTTLEGLQRRREEHEERRQNRSSLFGGQ